MPQAASGPAGERPRADRPRRAGLGAKLALLLGTTAVLLVPLELLARSHFAERDLRLSSAPPPPKAGEWTLIDLLRPSAHRDLVYELRPSLVGRFKGRPYRSNARGMRDAEVADRPADGAYRVALLGDSFSFAWGVDVEQGFADLLEARLSSELGGRPVEVLNFGVPGYNTATEAACLEHLAMPLQPDLVVVQYYFNDLNLPNFVLEEPRRAPLRIVDWIAERLRAPAAGPALVAPAAVEGVSSLDARFSDPRRVPPELAYMVGLDGVRHALERMRRAAGSAGAPLFLFMIEYPGPGLLVDASLPVTPPETSRAVQRIADELGIPRVGTLAGLVSRQRARGETMSPLILSDADWHPNATGHEVMASMLMDGLRASGVLERRR